MYQLLLTNRYLASRLTPLLAVAAVALCVALVIVVVSVMSGFLNMVQSSGRTLMGDVIISYPVRGIPYYDDLVERLEANEIVAAATPAIETWGLLRMPYPEGDAKESVKVQVWGIEPEGFAQVTSYLESLQWTKPPKEVIRHLLLDVIDSNANTLIAALDGPTRAALLQHTAPDSVAGMSADEIETLAVQLDNPAWDVRLRIVALEGVDAFRSTVNDAVWEAVVEVDPRLGPGTPTLEAGATLMRDGREGIVTGLHVSDANRRGSEGQTVIARDGYWWLPRFDVTLTTLPIDARGGILEPESISLPVANEYAAGVYLIDQTRVFVPIDLVQDITHLDEARLVDPDDPTTVIGTHPARATMVLVRGQDGVHPTQLRGVVDRIYDEFASAHGASFTPPPQRGLSPGLGIRTWEEQNASFIAPVQKERQLMQTLFSIIYVVCGALIVAIFWAIVYEKTRDIGILRSIGAPRSGIVMIFLLYGLVVSVLGSVAGVGLGWFVTTNVGSIHDGLSDPPLWPAWLLIGAGVALLAGGIITGRRRRMLPLLLGSYAMVACIAVAVGVILLRESGGMTIWDPSVYYFDEVPDQVDWREAITTAIGAVIASVIAASIPAARAADIDPVRALRYE
ncbi:MAG: ABC transporter permease [Phycisphaerales bacterium]|nr:ABC transporter permease [Phycisphaerales bacterium]